jgi:hypothetical protein
MGSGRLLAAFQHPFGADTAFEFQLEIAAEAVMILAALAAVVGLMFLSGQFAG